MGVLQTPPLATWVRRPVFLHLMTPDGDLLTYPSSNLIATPFFFSLHILKTEQGLNLSLDLSTVSGGHAAPSLAATEVLIALRS